MIHLAHSSPLFRSIINFGIFKYNERPYFQIIDIFYTTQKYLEAIHIFILQMRAPFFYCKLNSRSFS